MINDNMAFGDIRGLSLHLVSHCLNQLIDMIHKIMTMNHGNVQDAEISSISSVIGDTPKTCKVHPATRMESTTLRCRPSVPTPPVKIRRTFNSTDYPQSSIITRMNILTQSR